MVIATTDAVVALEHALTTWAHQSRGLWSQTATRVAAARAHIDLEYRRRTNRVAAITAALRATDSPARAAALEPELREAQQALRRAEGAVARVTGAEQQFHAAQRRAMTALDPAVAAARIDLQHRIQSLEQYGRGRATISERAAGGSLGEIATGASPGGFLPADMQHVDLNIVDFTNNPLIGKFGRDGVDIADYRWAVETWENVVAPGLAANLTRDDFTARDEARGARPLRRTADVHDMFLSDGAQILLTRRPDGSLDVTNGRHRIHVARQLGIATLPAKILS